MLCLNAFQNIYKCFSSKLIFKSVVSYRISTNFETNSRCFHKTSVTRDLMEFFDDKKNWGESEVKTGREWRKDELRIKSNSDLHKLWFVLYKEKNMLKTMEEAATDEVELFPSPERIDRVIQSMRNLEEVVRERNKAYWELEVGEGLTGERQKAFRRDIFGRWKWIGCSEHLVPYKLNTKWRALNAPHFGPEVIDFNRRLKEKEILKKKTNILKDKILVRQLLRRFPDVDIEYLKELYPDVNIDDQKENLDEYIRSMRWNKFHYLTYSSKTNKK